MFYIKNCIFYIKNKRNNRYFIAYAEFDMVKRASLLFIIN